MEGFKFELGDNVKDQITGYSGIIMGRTQYLTQCSCYGVSTTDLGADGKRKDWEWFDEPRLALTGKKRFSLATVPVKKTGGPHSKGEIAPGR
jgi:hypothetical protein